MTQSFFARLFSVFGLIALCHGAAFAQSTKVNMKQKINKTGPITDADETLVSAAPAPAETAPARSPWRISYFAEYQGPPMGNIDLAKTKTPHGETEYSQIDHSVKVGYAVSNAVNVGTQVRATSPFDPAKQLSFPDLRLYSSWNHMIETKDLDVQGVLKLEFPTTDKSRGRGKIMAISIDNNWVLKTELRNWSFSAATMVRPIFYNDPASGGGKTDLLLGLFPYITVDLSPNTQLLFEGSFDASHNYSAILYDYQPGDPDFINVGPIFTINSHVSTNVALRFFTDNISFKQAALYMNVSAAL